MMGKLFSGIVVAFTTLLFFVSLTVGQVPDAPDIADLPSGVTLPEVVSATSAAQLINSSNAQAFREIVIPELYGLVRSGAFQMESGRRLQYAWRYDDEFEKNSQTPYAGGLAGNGWIQNGDLFKRWLVFGNSGEIEKESDPALKGQRVLWNINSVWWSQGLLNFEFELFKAASGGAENVTRGVFQRVYPHMLDGADKTEQLFREKITFLSPAFLKAFGFLSFRFIGQDEDIVWLHSPLIDKTRELTGSNRADALARSAMSADDLLVWSGKPGLVQAHVDRSLVGLVPFSRVDLGQFDAPVSGCETLPSPGGGNWNFSTNRFLNAAPWLPVGSLFVPRRLLRLEMTSRDPFSLYGRQILYVDASMMLPVYKIVYDRAGRLWKIIMAASGLAASHDRKRRIPYLSYLVVVDLLNNRNAIMRFSKVEYCSSYEKLKLSDFDPRRFSPESYSDSKAQVAPLVTTTVIGGATGLETED